MSENKKKNSLLSRQEVRQQYGLSVRFLEECHRKTKLTGELVGPYCYQFENTTKYSEIHIEKYMEECLINKETAKKLEKKCEKSKKICEKYSLAKKEKKAPQIPQINKKIKGTLVNQQKKIS